MSAIFLSHSSKDNSVAARVRERLKAEGHQWIFLDFDPADGIPAGRDWERELYQQLRACQAVVVLCSRHSMASRWCFAEITHAKALGKYLFPVKIDDCEVDPVLTARQVIDLTAGEEEAYRRLLRGLKVAGLDDAFAPVEGRPPYPGLMAFQEEDAAVFFGRSAEIQEGLELLNLLRRLGGVRTVMVLGASGSGKSSLVRAGLVPRLRRDPQAWLVTDPLRPQEQGVKALALVLAKAFSAHGHPRAWSGLQARLEKAAGADPAHGDVLIGFAEELRGVAGRPDATVLLVIDQAEELLGDAAGAHALLRLLQAALAAPNSPLMAVFTLRSDFLGAFQQHPVGRDLDFKDLRVGPMAVDRLVQVIEKPAAMTGIALEPGLTEALIADTETEDALPLLAFTLRELYERYGDDKLLEIDEYRDKLGGLAGSVAKAAGAVLGEKPLSDTDEAALRKSFLEMARINEEGRYARRTVQWADLPAPAHTLLERFVAARLLVARGEDEGRTLEVAHEALFRSWDRLKGWLDKDREFLLWRKRLGEAYETWKRTGCDPGALLRGALLAEADQWLAQRPDLLRPPHQAFIRESVALQQREAAEEEARRRRELEAERERAEEQAAASRRFRRLSGALAGVLVLALGAAVVAWVQQNRAETQSRRNLALQLAAQADATLDDTGEGLERSLLLATESLKATWTHEGYGAWARAAVLLPRRATHWIDTEGAATLDLAYHPTQPWLAVLGADSTLRIRHTGDGRLVRDLPFEEINDFLFSERTPALQFSPDGHWLAVTGIEQFAVWDTETWRRRDFGANTDGHFDLAFNDAGDLLAYAGRYQPLTVLSTGSWEPNLTTESSVANVVAIDFGPCATDSTDACRFASAASNDRVAFWSFLRDPPGLNAAIFEGSSADFMDLSFSHRGDQIALSSRAALRLWSTSALEEAYGRVFSPAGDTAGFRLGDLDEAEGSWTVSVPDLVGVAVSPDDRYLVTGGTGVRLWEANTGRELARVPSGNVAAFSPGGDTLAVGGVQTGLMPISGRDGAAFIAHDSDVLSVAFSPDGRWLATGQENGELCVFDTEAWDDVYRQAVEQEVQFVAFTPDGRSLVAQRGQGDQTSLHAYRIGAWAAVPPMLHEDGGLTMYVSPDGRHLKTLTPSLVDRYEGLKRASRTRIWDLASGREVAWRSHEDEDPDPFGRPPEALAEGTLPLGEGGTIGLLDQSKNWKELTFSEQIRRRGSPDGRWSASWNGEAITLSEPATGREIVTIPMAGSVRDLSVDPEGRWFATADGAGVTVWLLGPVDELVEEACARLSRNLSPEEWSRYRDGEPEKTCSLLPGPEEQ